MEKKGKNKRRKRNGPFYMVVLLIGLYVSWIFVDQQLKLQELITQENELNKRITGLKTEVKSLEKEKEKGNDPGYIEKIAREELKMVKPNEIIYIDLNKSKVNYGN